MSLEIFYEALVDDKGAIIGAQLVLENNGKYLSIEDYQNKKFIFFDDVEDVGEEAMLDMTQEENFDKINDLIEKVLE